MTAEQTIKILSDKISKLKTEVAKEEGVLESVLKVMKDSYGIDNIEDAEKLLKEKLAKKEELEKERDELLEIAERKLKQYE